MGVLGQAQQEEEGARGEHLRAEGMHAAAQHLGPVKSDRCKLHSLEKRARVSTQTKSSNFGYLQALIKVF